MNHSSVEYAQYKAQRIKDLIPEFNRSGVNILDFGCGSGLMTNYLQEVFFEAKVIGLDESEKAIVQAKQNYPEITFSVIKNSKLDFPNNYFDLVIVADVLHHIPFDKHKHWIQEIMRVLKPDDYFILLELNPWNIFTWYEFKNNPLEKHAEMLSPWYAKKLLHVCKDLNVYFFSYFFKKLPFCRIYSIVCRKQ